MFVILTIPWCTLLISDADADSTTVEGPDADADLLTQYADADPDVRWWSRTHLMQMLMLTQRCWFWCRYLKRCLLTWRRCWSWLRCTADSRCWPQMHLVDWCRYWSLMQMLKRLDALKLILMQMLMLTLMQIQTHLLILMRMSMTWLQTPKLIPLCRCWCWTLMQIAEADSWADRSWFPDCGSGIHLLRNFDWLTMQMQIQNEIDSDVVLMLIVKDSCRVDCDTDQISRLLILWTLWLVALLILIQIVTRCYFYLSDTDCGWKPLLSWILIQIVTQDATSDSDDCI